MHGSLPVLTRYARETEGRILSGEDKIVPPPNWVWFARHLWPTKTAAHLAAIANKDERTAKRWLAGEFEPPGVVMAALIAKLYERKA
jgi:hypothetical protein